MNFKNITGARTARPLGAFSLNEIIICIAIICLPPALAIPKAIAAAGDAGIVYGGASPGIVLVYPLTNSTTFTLTSTGTNVAAASQVTINSQPFPIFPGRGFAYQLSCLSTSPVSSLNTTSIFQFAIVRTNITGPVTNWSDSGKLFVVMPVSGQGGGGTTYAHDITNIVSTLVDNYSLGRLQFLGNADTNTVRFEPTNTFIGVNPFVK